MRRSSPATHAARTPVQSYGVPQPTEQRFGGEFIPRHRHHAGYVTLVVSGMYREEGDEGRLMLEPGQVVLHRAFEAHRNVVGVRGCKLISFAAPPSLPQGTLFRSDDVDAIVRTARRDPAEAIGMLLRGLQPARARIVDWPDLLAAWIRQDCRGRIDSWAAANGLARETVSRGFRRAFGISPAQYRWEARTRAALRSITKTPAPLCRVAAECGFADQPHMTRAVRAMTGRSPCEWRRMSHPFKTPADPSP